MDENSDEMAANPSLQEVHEDSPAVAVAAVEEIYEPEDVSVLMDAEDQTNADSIEDDDDLDDEVETVRSEEASVETSSKAKLTPSSKAAPRKSIGGSGRKGRAPSVKGLTIPFRTVKKAMKLDPNTPIVQNEAAIMTTLAAELFLKRLAKDSHRNSKNRLRNTIRYEDIAEARTRNPALSFLETLLP